MLSELQHLPDRYAWPEPLRLAYSPPDWNYWTNLADATLDELVCLSLDLDPIQYLGEEPDASRIVKMTLGLARYHSRLGIAENNAQAGILPTRINVKPYRACFSDFVCWANNLKPAWELPEALKSAAELHRPPPGRCGKWPWGDYETPLLQILAEAVNHFCLAGDYPKKGEVVDWVKERICEAGLQSSDTLADKIETIISPRPYSHHRQRKSR